MATFFSFYTSCSLVLVLFSLFLPTNGAPVDDVCRQTKDTPLCLDVFSFDPTIQNEPLPNLAQIAIQVAGLDANGIKRKFEELLNTTKDAKLKTLYGQCEELYNNALTTLRAANDDVKGRRWGELYAKAGRVGGDVDECEKAFKNSSPVHKESHEVEVLAEALGVIAKALSRMKFL